MSRSASQHPFAAVVTASGNASPSAALTLGGGVGVCSDDGMVIGDAGAFEPIDLNALCPPVAQLPPVHTLLADVYAAGAAPPPVPAPVRSNTQHLFDTFLSAERPLSLPGLPSPVHHHHHPTQPQHPLPPPLRSTAVPAAGLKPTPAPASMRHSALNLKPNSPPTALPSLAPPALHFPQSVSPPNNLARITAPVITPAPAMPSVLVPSATVGAGAGTGDAAVKATSPYAGLTDRARLQSKRVSRKRKVEARSDSASPSGSSVAGNADAVPPLGEHWSPASATSSIKTATPEADADADLAVAATTSAPAKGKAVKATATSGKASAALDDSDSDDGRVLTPEEERKRKRRKSNRAAAQQSRLRKKMALEDLQGKVNALLAQNATLVKSLEGLKQENATLRKSLTPNEQIQRATQKPQPQPRHVQQHQQHQHQLQRMQSSPEGSDRDAATARLTHAQQHARYQQQLTQPHARAQHQQHQLQSQSQHQSQTQSPFQTHPQPFQPSASPYPTFAAMRSAPGAITAADTSASLDHLYAEQSADQFQSHSPTHQHQQHSQSQSQGVDDTTAFGGVSGSSAISNSSSSSSSNLSTSSSSSSSGFGQSRTGGAAAFSAVNPDTSIGRASPRSADAGPISSTHSDTAVVSSPQQPGVQPMAGVVATQEQARSAHRSRANAQSNTTTTNAQEQPMSPLQLSPQTPLPPQPLPHTPSQQPERPSRLTTSQPPQPSAARLPSPQSPQSPPTTSYRVSFSSRSLAKLATRDAARARANQQQMVGVFFLCLTLSTASLRAAITGSSRLFTQPIRQTQHTLPPYHSNTFWEAPASSPPPPNSNPFRTPSASAQQNPNPWALPSTLFKTDSLWTTAPSKRRTAKQTHTQTQRKTQRRRPPIALVPRVVPSTPAAVAAAAGSIPIRSSVQRTIWLNFRGTNPTHPLHAQSASAQSFAANTSRYVNAKAATLQHTPQPTPSHAQSTARHPSGPPFVQLSVRINLVA